jgi:hypothetical protein
VYLDTVDDHYVIKIDEDKLIEKVITCCKTTVQPTSQTNNQQLCPSTAKFWCKFDATLSTIEKPKTQYGISNINHFGRGEYKINYNFSFANSNYVVIPTSCHPLAQPLHIVIHNQTQTYCYLRVTNIDGTVTDPDSISLVGYGDV